MDYLANWTDTIFVNNYSNWRPFIQSNDLDGILISFRSDF